MEVILLQDVENLGDNRCTDNLPYVQVFAIQQLTQVEFFHTSNVFELYINVGKLAGAVRGVVVDTLEAAQEITVGSSEHAESKPSPEAQKVRQVARVVAEVDRQFGHFNGSGFTA